MYRKNTKMMSMGKNGGRQGPYANGKNWYNCKNKWGRKLERNEEMGWWDGGISLHVAAAILFTPKLRGPAKPCGHQTDTYHIVIWCRCVGFVLLQPQRIKLMFRRLFVIYIYIHTYKHIHIYIDVYTLMLGWWWHVISVYVWMYVYTYIHTYWKWYHIGYITCF